MLTIDAPSREFIESVVAQRPGIAVFDCDGTLWSGDSGAEFFYWEIDRGLLPKSVVDWAIPRYQAYLRGEVGEEPMCGEMVTIHAGLDEKLLSEASEQFFQERFESQIFPDMQELVARLAQAGCEIWAVSSTNEWVVRAGARRFGISPQRVLAACVHTEQGRATARLRDVPTDEGKAVSIRANIKQEVDAVFGNSIHDQQMLELARNAFAVNPTPELAAIARERAWNVYLPVAVRQP